MTLKKSRLDYKWVVLITCFLMEFLCLGFCSSNVGLFTVPVTSALHIDRLDYSYWSSIRYAVQVVVALYFGSLVNRFGIKKMVFAGLLGLIGATALRMLGTNVWHFYIAGALHGFGIVFVGGTMAGTIVRRWFKEDIGKYTGIVMSANGVGGAISAQIFAPLIDNGTFGYRKAYLLSVIVTLTISVFIMIFLRDKPGDGPVVAGKQKKQPKKGSLWVGIEYDVAKKKAYFYLAAALIFLTGISLQSIGSITLVYLSDLGFTTTFFATTATVSSLVLTFSKMLAGTAYDKWGLRLSLLMCQVAGLCTFLLKALLTGNTTLGMVMAMTATVLSSIAAPLETVMIPLLTNDLFGSASYNKVLGIFMAMNSLGLCLGSPLGELIRKVFGTYRVCFWIFSALLVVVIISFQFIISTAQKQKNTILAAENI